MTGGLPPLFFEVIGAVGGFCIFFDSPPHQRVYLHVLDLDGLSTATLKPLEGHGAAAERINLRAAARAFMMDISGILEASDSANILMALECKAAIWWLIIF